MFMVPPAIRTDSPPFIPSSVAFTVRVVSVILIPSFACRPSFGAVTVIFPPAMTSLSLQSIPCLYDAVMVREPSPFIVRSS